MYAYMNTITHCLSTYQLSKFRPLRTGPPAFMYMYTYLPVIEQGRA